MAVRSTFKPWWTAEKGKLHEQVLATVIEIERRQNDVFERFWRLECLYDPNTVNANQGSRTSELLGQVTENVIASNVDTVTAVIAATDVRARFMTDDGDWEDQRKAKHLEWYAEGIAKLLDVAPKCRVGFTSSAKKGTGICHVYVDPFNQPRVDAVIIDDIVVDEQETRDGGQPKQIHRRKNVDIDELKAMYPGNDAAIDRALAGGSRSRRMRVNNRTYSNNEIGIIYSWRLPIGVKGERGYKAGRFGVTCDGVDLEDKKWEKPYFPISEIRWSKREGGWYGISLAERISGHQRALNKRNWQIDRVLDQGASVTTYVRPIDADVAVKTQSKIGSIAVIRGEYPQTIAPPQVHPEVYQNREMMKAAAFEESGVSRMASQSVKPAGIDSAVAMREYRDQTTQRFSMQEKAFEQFVLDTILLVLDVCKDLGKDAPVIMRRTKFGAKKVQWSKVDMGDVKVMIAAASTLSRTPAGRMQTVIEWAQAGIISQDDARRLMDHPDLERAMSLYTAAVEVLDYCFDEIADGQIIMPEPFMNLDLAVHRGQMQYLNWLMDGAPENVLEAMRQFVVQAADMANPAPPQAAPDAGAMPDAAGAMPPGPGPQQMPQGGPMPMGAPAQAALSPQAMQLKAV